MWSNKDYKSIFAVIDLCSRLLNEIGYNWRETTEMNEKKNRRQLLRSPPPKENDEDNKNTTQNANQQMTLKQCGGSVFATREFSRVQLITQTHNQFFLIDLLVYRFLILCFAFNSYSVRYKRNALFLHSFTCAFISKYIWICFSG